MEENRDRNEMGSELSDESASSTAREPVETVDAGVKGVQRRESGGKVTGLLIAVAFFSAIIGALVATYAVPYMYGSTPATVFGSRQAQPGSSKGTIINVKNGSVSPATAVAEKLRPSVVNISVNQGPQDRIHSNLTGGVGSGVIYTEDGYILTNNHVVSGAREIFVTIGTDEVKARLIAADAETDLAVLKVDRKGLNAAEFGTTKDLKVGEPAVAIGSPFGFEHTVTSGIISALNRTLTIPDEQTGESVVFTDLIQTDAAINPGNSGGILSDASGKVIGINTLIISSSGASEGVGFAIPVETAKNVASQLIEKGKASHPYMGILGRNASDIATEDSGITAKQGAVVIEVLPGSPSAKAGLRKDDIITAVEDGRIEDMDDLIAEIRQRKVGDSVEITYLRNGKSNKTRLNLAEKPSR